MIQKKRKLVDLAQEIREGQPVYGNHHKTYIFQHTTFEETARLYRIPFQTRNLLINEHGPTHVDAHADLVVRRDVLVRNELRFNAYEICLLKRRCPKETHRDRTPVGNRWDSGRVLDHTVDGEIDHHVRLVAVSAVHDRRSDVCGRAELES